MSDGFVRGKGKFILTEYVATDERTGPRFPLLLTTGRILSQYNVGAQTRRTENVVWHDEDVLEIHPHDAENRGVKRRRLGQAAEPRRRDDAACADHRPGAPGVVYTTFHHPDTQANVITTDFSDWATNCPEYKVTAVQVGPRTARRRRVAAADRGGGMSGHSPLGDRDEHIATGTNERLVYMANQMARFFVSQKHDQAVAGLADHIVKFWDPRMKAMIAAHLTAGGEGLEPLAREALAVVGERTAAKEARRADGR
jgi:hypothetical protein